MNRNNNIINTFVTLAIFSFLLSSCDIIDPPDTGSKPKAPSEFQIAINAYNQGDYATAFEKFSNLASEGEVTSQYNIGLMYEKGNGVKRNLAKAKYWYLKAANQNYSAAQRNLGQMYITGNFGVKQDYKKSLYWFEKAGDQGESYPLHMLGYQYFHGYGTIVDKSKALKYWRLAVISYKKKGDTKMVKHIQNEDINMKICKKDALLCKQKNQ